MKQADRITVFIADDHELTRMGLQMLITGRQEFEVVGVAVNGKQAIEAVEQLRPDVVILDLQMPILDGLSAAARIKQSSPNTKIIAYTSVEDPQIEVMTQTAPIDLYCPKDISSQDLVEAIAELGKLARVKPTSLTSR
jgi:DNA-binding NarL/FixJ family response regulator